MDWQALKENLHLWYVRAAQFYLFQSLVLYIVACIAAGHPLGPARYAAFVFHLFSFR